MIKDAMEFLKGLVSKAEVLKAPLVTMLPGRGNKYILTKVDGSAQEMADPPPRSHRVDSVASLMTAIVKWGREIPPVVYVGEKSIIVVIDDQEDRLDTITLPLTKHKQWVELESLGGGRDQKSIVRLLRHNFAGCVPEGFVARLRQLAFNRRNDGSATVTHGKESLGHAVEASVSNSESIPEDILFRVPMFDLDLDTRQSIKVTVEIDPLAGQIALDPVPGELEFARTRQLESIAESIRNGCDVTVLMGSPHK